MLQFFQWGILLQVLAILHFIRRRPETFWLWVVIFFGPPGALIYILMEVVPDLGLVRQSFEGFGRRKRHQVPRSAGARKTPQPATMKSWATSISMSRKFARARECYDKAITPRTTDLDPFYRRGVAEDGARRLRRGHRGPRLCDVAGSRNTTRTAPEACWRTPSDRPGDTADAESLFNRSPRPRRSRRPT